MKQQDNPNLQAGTALSLASWAADCLYAAISGWLHATMLLTVYAKFDD